MRKIDKNKHQPVEDILERCVAAVILICSFPFLLVIACIILITSGLPILFVQERVGKNGKVFRMYKFRTMRLGAENEQKSLEKLNEAIYPTFKIRNDPRFTKVGKFLSLTGFDELPQFLNVLLGDMSIIGPRPLPVKEHHKLPKSAYFRTSVLPGILSTWVLQKKTILNIQQLIKQDKKDILSDSFLFKLGLILRYFIMLIQTIKKYAK